MLKFYAFKSHYLTLVVILFTAFGLSAQDVTADPSSITFSNLNTGEQENMFTNLTNNTANNWSLIEFAITGPDADQFSEANNPGLPFGPGAMAEVQASFNPTTEGSKTATLTVTYGNFGNPAGTIDIPLSGSAGVVLEPIIEVMDIDFGTTDIFVDLQETVTMMNTGNTDLEISNIELLDFADDDQFSIITSLTFPITIAVGESSTFMVGHNAQPQAPGAGADDRLANIRFTSNDPNSPNNISLESTVFLPQIEVQNNPFEFGNVGVGQPTALTVNVNNTGPGTLVLSDLYFSGAPPTTSGDNADFAVTDPTSLPVNVAPNSSTLIEVTFTPSGTGTRSTFLRIETVNSDPLSSIFTRGVGQESGFFVNMNPIEFDDTDVGSFDQVNYRIENTGDIDLELSSGTITGVNASEFMINTSNNPVTLQPGPTNSITNQVEFNPTTDYGMRTATLTYTSNAPDSPHEITLIGLALDSDTSISTTSLSFEDLSIGQVSVPQTITLTNVGNKDDSITGITINGTDASEFAVENLTFPVTIPAEGDFNFDAIFQPQTEGSKTATIQITTGENLQTFDVAVSGNGLEPDIQLSTTSFDFGNIVVQSSSASQTLTISNLNGEGDLVIDVLAISGDNADQFELVGDFTTPITVEAGQELQVPVQFSPTTAGNQLAQIDIESNDLSSPNVVSLTGFGLAPVFAFNRETIQFRDASVNVNTRIEFVTVTNAGDANLVLNAIAFESPSDDFSIEAQPTPITLMPTESHTMQVGFLPTVRGERTAILQFETELGEILTIDCLGTGLGQDMTLSGQDSPGVNFGEVVNGQTYRRDFVLTNIGESEGVITGVNFSGPDADKFSLDNAITFPFSLASGQSFSDISNASQILFTPGETGSFNATLQFTTDLNTDVIESINLSGSAINAATLTPQQEPFVVPTTNTGEDVIYDVPVTNTGSLSLVIKNSYNFASNTDRLTAAFTNASGPDSVYPITLEPGQSGNIPVRFRPDGSVDFYQTTIAVVTDENTSNSDFFCPVPACGASSGYVHFVDVVGGVNRAKLELVESLDENGNVIPIEFPETSIGRQADQIVTVRNSGSFRFDLEFFGTQPTGEFRFVYPETAEERIFEAGQERELTIIFEPQGTTLGERNGSFDIRTNIANPPDNFTLHNFDVTGTATEPEEVAVGGLIFEADRRTLQPDGVTWLMQGNVHAGKLEYSGDVLVNTEAMTVESLEPIDVFINDIPEVGDFGGERVLLQSGMIDQTVDNVDPVLNVAVGSAAAGVSAAFTMIGLPLEITTFKLIDETVGGVRKRGVEVGGALALPAEIFGEDANITLERLRIDDVDGVNVMGSAEIAPELMILNTFQLNNTSIEFDTFNNSFGGSAEVQISLVDKDITIAAEVQILNGGLDSVSLEVEVDPGIPIASTGFSLAGGNGFINGIQEPPLSLGLGVDIVPTVSPVDLRLDNMQIAYTLGTSLSASGTIQLYGEDLGGGDVTIKANGVTVSAFVNLYNIFKGNASLTVENRFDEDAMENFLFFETTATLSITIPAIEDTGICIPCEAVNNFLPVTVAEISVLLNNTTVRGSLRVADEVDLVVESKRQEDGSYDTSFSANFGIINLSFFNGQSPSSFNNSYYFENNEELQLISDGQEGRSLVIPAATQSSLAPVDIPFTLNESQRNIILRIEGDNGTPFYTLRLPDGTEVTPENAESLGYLATTYEEENKRFYILSDTPVGEYTIHIDDNDTYQFDLLGAEFAPTLAINTVTQDAPNDTVTFTWEDGDLDSDASIAFYYDTDDKDGNGNLIVEGISEDDNTDSFTFDTSELKNGEYFIYGTIKDDVEDAETFNEATTAYGLQPFVINKETGIDATILFGELDDNIFELSWSPITEANFYNVYITEDDETVTLFSDNQNVGNASSFDFSEIEAGRTYNFAVTAVMEGDNGLFVESPLSNIINFSHISPDENNLPRIETTDLPDYTDACTMYTETITSSDVDSEDILTLSLAIAPEGMTLSGNTISWRPTVEQLGQNQVVFEVNDGNGGIVQKQLIIAVLEADDLGPVPDVETLTDIVEECNATLTAPTATDDCSGSITATTDDDTVYTEQGTYQVTWTYTDGNGNEVEQIQNVTIEDTTSPEFDNATLPTNTSREADLNNEYSLEDFTSGVTFVENCSAVITQDPIAGTVLTPGIYDITLTVTDVANQTDVHTFELEVIENSLGVDDITTQEFNLYPNPTERFIMINNPNNEVITSVEVYDLNGKVVKRRIPSTSINDIEIDTSSLQTGMYLMKINTEAGQTVKTFLKE